MHTRTLFAAITILLLFISASLAIVLADGPLPGVDTAERDDVVVEDDGGGASGAVDEDDGTRLPDVDTAERDDVVPEDDGGGASGAVDEDSGARHPPTIRHGRTWVLLSMLSAASWEPEMVISNCREFQTPARPDR